MFYTFTVPVPASTPEDSPVIVAAPIYPATINRVMVQFPTGAAGLAHCRIMRGLTQVWPTNYGDSFAGDGETVDFVEDYPLDAEPYLFKILAWNDDDAYPHTLTVKFGVLLLAAQGGGGVLDQIRGFLGVS